MSVIVEGFLKALTLLGSFDPEVYGIIFLSFQVSGIAVLVGSLIGIPAGAAIGMREFLGKRLVVGAVNTLIALPPVVVGLLLYLALSVSGPLGPLQLLYTPTAMILAQLIEVIPIVTGVVASGVASIDPSVKEKSISLGATETQLVFTVLLEARLALLTGVVLGFGRAISEVGAIMIVGGNIRYVSRVLTTAIVQSVSLGEFEVAMALGIILLAVAFLINMLLTQLQIGYRSRTVVTV